METVNIKAIQLDLKKPKLTTIGDFIQNDTNIIKFTLTENGSVIDLDVIDQILINYKKPSGEVISRVVTAEADVITYQLGFAEMSEAGLGKLVIQFFKSDNRISTFTVDVNIKKSIESNFSFEEAEKGLVDQVIQEINLVNTRIDNIAFDGVDTSKIATKEDLRSLATKTDLTSIESEISAAKSGYNTLAQKLNSMVTEGGNGALVFQTLSDLQSAFPNGTNQPVWIEAEKSWYYWVDEDTIPEPSDNIPPILTVTGGGNFTGSKSVTMSANETAVIYYTLDGSTPTVNSQRYISPLTISSTTTLKAFARDTAGNDSAIQTINYTLVVPEPGDTTPPNNVTNLQVTNNTTGTSLTLTWTASTSSDVTGYEIYRGTTLLVTVTGSSYNVTGLTANTEYTFTVKAKDASNNSASGTSVTVTATYIDNVPPVLTITEGGTFTDTKQVTMSTDETATIYYTLDGSTPTAASLVYENPLTLTETVIVKAFAKDALGNESAVRTVTYTKETAPTEDIVTDGLMFWYDGRDGNNSTPTRIWDDRSINGYDGNLPSFWEFAPSTSNGWTGTGLKFSAPKSAYVGTGRSITSPNYTIETYFEFHSAPSTKDDSIITQRGLGLMNGISIGHTTNSQNLFLRRINPTTATNFQLITGYQLNRKYHIAVVCEQIDTNNARYTGYVDGVEVFNNTDAYTSALDSAYKLTIGGLNNSGSHSSNMILYTQRVYTKALTAAEVTNNYNEEISITR